MALITVAAFVGLLIAAVGISAMLAMKARRAEAIAEAKKIEAEANAKIAEEERDKTIHLNGVIDGQAVALRGRLNEAELNGFSLRTDLDLAEVQTDSKVGLLRLASTLRTLETTLQSALAGPNDDDLKIKTRQLREFITMAVLATGQKFAPLLPPIRHDGIELAPSILNSTGDRLLTGGVDKRVRLWDTATGRLICELMEGEEKVVEMGLSPDGATAFTHSLDGIVRLWETKDGSLRAQTEPRPGRKKWIGREYSRYINKASGYEHVVSQLSNDRLLTWSEIRSEGALPQHPGPAELWDSRSGRLIARLQADEGFRSDFNFFGDGQWIQSWDSESGSVVAQVFSSMDGKFLANLKPEPVNNSIRWGHQLFVSPSRRTISFLIYTNKNMYVQNWEPTSWKSTSIHGPLTIAPNYDYSMIYLDESTFIVGLEDRTQGDGPCRVFAKVRLTRSHRSPTFLNPSRTA